MILEGEPSLDSLVSNHLIVESEFTGIIEQMEVGGWSRIVAPSSTQWSETSQDRVSLGVVIDHCVQSGGVLVGSALTDCLPSPTPTVITVTG